MLKKFLMWILWNNVPLKYHCDTRACWIYWYWHGRTLGGTVSLWWRVAVSPVRARDGCYSPAGVELLTMEQRLQPCPCFRSRWSLHVDAHRGWCNKSVPGADKWGGSRAKQRQLQELHSFKDPAKSKGGKRCSQIHWLKTWRGFQPPGDSGH